MIRTRNNLPKINRKEKNEANSPPLPIEINCAQKIGAIKTRDKSIALNCIFYPQIDLKIKLRKE